MSRMSLIASNDESSGQLIASGDNFAVSAR